MSVDIQESDQAQVSSQTSFIQLTSVTKRFQTKFGDVVAVDDVSLTIENGEWVNIQGSSGSGKSTLLSLIGGLTEPDDGSVCVDGLDVTRMNQQTRAELRAAKIGFVFQMFHLLPYLSVIENIQAAATRLNSESRERALELAEQFKIDDRINHRPGQLSTGQRQRAALARAMFNDPTILLADEPTGNLDAENSAIVIESLEQYNANGGTVVLVSHDPRMTDRGQRSLTMNNGRFV